MRRFVLATIVALSGIVLTRGAECPPEYVCIPKGMEPAAVAEMEQWQKELGVIAFTIPQASQIGQQLIEADKQVALAKLRQRGFGWVMDVGWRGDTTDGENGIFAAIGPRFTWKGLSLFVQGEAWGVDAALRAGVRVEF